MADWLEDTDSADPAYDKEVWNRDLQKMSNKHKNVRWLLAPCAIYICQTGFKEVISDAKDMTLQAVRCINCISTHARRDSTRASARELSQEGHGAN